MNNNNNDHGSRRRFRRLVSEMEPDVHEVPRVFRSLLRECTDESSGGEDARARAGGLFGRQQRSKSLSFVTFRSKFRTGQLFRGGGGGSRGNLDQQVDWSDEEDAQGEEEEEVEAIKARARKGRSRSMPEISPVEQSAQG